jgi:mycofactocin precursor
MGEAGVRRMTVQGWVTRGRPRLAMASGRPIRSSQTTVSTSRVPRFLMPVSILLGVGFPAQAGTFPLGRQRLIGMIYCRPHRLTGAPPDGGTSSPPRIATERAGVGQILRAAVLIGSTAGQRGPGRGQRRRREGASRPRASASCKGRAGLAELPSHQAGDVDTSGSERDGRHAAGTQMTPRKSSRSAGGGSPGSGRRWQRRVRARGVPAVGPAREAGMTKQAVTVLVPERSAAASDKTAEQAAGGDKALVAGELLVEEVSIDGMCGVY